MIHNNVSHFDDFDCLKIAFGHSRKIKVQDALAALTGEFGFFIWFFCQFNFVQCGSIISVEAKFDFHFDVAVWLQSSLGENKSTKHTCVLKSQTPLITKP